MKPLIALVRVHVKQGIGQENEENEPSSGMAMFMQLVINLMFA